MNRGLKSAVVVILWAGLALPGLAGQQPPPAGQAPAAPVVTEQSELQAIFQAVDPVQRLALIDQFLGKYPQTSYRGMIYAAAADAYRMQNNLDKAVESAEKGLESDPGNAGTMIWLAQVFTESAQPSEADFKDKLEKAENYCQKALAALPEFVQKALVARPDVTPEQKQLQETYMAAQAHSTLGYVYYRREELDKAESELQMATDMNQMQPSAADFELLGMVEEALKKFDLAKVSFERCMALEMEAGGGEVCKDRLARLEQSVQQEQPQAPPPPQP